MPSASPSQYICNMLDEMEQDPLQPPLVVDTRPTEAYTDCTNSYGQSNFDIEDFMTEPAPFENARRQCRLSEYNPGYVNFISNSRQIDYLQDRNDFNGSAYNNSDGVHRIPELINYANNEERLRFETSPGCKNLYSHHQEQCAQQQDRQYSPYHNLDRKEKTPNTESEFHQWSSKHPENWNQKEVLDWIFYSAEKLRLDCGLLRAENFRSITGADLCKMGLEEFKRLEQNYGSLFFDMFRNLCDGLAYTQTLQQAGHCMDIEDAAVVNSSHRHPPVHMNSDPGPIEQYSPIEYCKREIKTEPATTDGVFYELQHITPPYDCRPMSQPPYLQSDHQIPTSIQNCGAYPNHFMYPDFNPHHMAARQRHISEDHIPTQIPRRRPGRPRIKSLPLDEEVQREKKAKNQHLWEFIYQILMNPMYNPQFLRWENQREGVFRFVQSEAVAQLWGGLKNNENMTYEKLSRAMRHYYKRGILERVEGRRLVYKFSRVAMDRVREKRYSV